MASMFCDRLLSAPVGGGFAMDDYWVWCGSVIQGDDGRYHMFASRWPRSLAFIPHWLTNSEVVRATSPTPEGPYTFAEVVLPARGGASWDGRMTHNPTIHRSGNTYLLYYIGTTYDCPTPTAARQESSSAPCVRQARNNQRIGLATAPSLAGPWPRRDEPIIQPRPGKWDDLFTANPAPLVEADGSVLLVYKARDSKQDLMRHGLTRAARYDAPYERVQDEPIFPEALAGQVEDPFIWRGDGGYEMLLHDPSGAVAGEQHAIAHARSADARTWQWSTPDLACGRTVRWEDGHISRQPRVERPQLLLDGDRPTHLFMATGDGPVEPGRGDRNSMRRSWNMVIPLA